MNNIYKLALAILIPLFFSSCEEEMKLDLKTAESQIVIDAAISEKMPCTVILSLSQSFYNNDSYERITGATIILTDEDGNSETLYEEHFDAGSYTSTQIIGITGMRYNLKVIIDGETYEANATIPTKVELLDIHLYEIKAGDKSWYSPSVEFDDPEDEQNYYYFIMTVNDKVLQTVYLNDDEHRNGKRIHRILYFNKKDNDDEELNTGDYVEVEMHTLDYGMYKFYQTWLSYSGGDANPATNFSGGALGCFKAYNTSWLTMNVGPECIYKENN